MNQTTPESIDMEKVKRDRDQHALEQSLHHMLVGGVVISSLLMFSGLVLGLILNGNLPETVPQLEQIIPMALRLEPSGIVALGLLTLIATPILRVAGSVLAFLFERDWRYAFITFIVLLIVIFSILVGRG
jgi:uncharacterized membrane protein